MTKLIFELDEFVAKRVKRRQRLGISDADVDRARNSGRRRTSNKRALLEAAQRRAQEAGVVFMPSNF